MVSSLWATGTEEFSGALAGWVYFFQTSFYFFYSYFLKQKEKHLEIKVEKLKPTMYKLYIVWHFFWLF